MSDMKAVLQILVDQVSKQQASLDQVIVRVSQLEETCNKQQVLINKLAKTTNKNSSTASLLSRAQELKNQVSAKSTHIASVTSSRARSTTVALSSRRQAKVKCLKKTHKLSRVTKTKTSSLGKIKRPGHRKTPHTKLKSRSLSRSESIGASATDQFTQNADEITSSETDRSSLLSIDSVLRKYQHYIREGRVCALARRLAEEAVIGKEVLKKCRLNGYFCRLPVDSLNTIKQTLLSVFPQYCDYPDKFTDLWVLCKRRILCLCSRLRYLDRKAQEMELDSSLDQPSSLDQSLPPPVLSPLTCLAKSQSSISSPTVVPVRNVRNPLPSSEVDRRGLMSVEEFLSLHSTKIKEGKYTMSHLFRKLACFCFFGKEVLIKCTPTGYGQNTGLPVVELNQLKQTLMDCFPRYWDHPDLFEAEWSSMWRITLYGLSAKLKQGFIL